MSSKKPFKSNVFAAGAVVWRKSTDTPDDVELALVHRRKYDDWSFPKGKLDPGETELVAAIREVGEETGMTIRTGRHLGSVSYPVPGHRLRKRVEYWNGEAISGEFVPNSEVDELRWVPVGDVADQLSYPMDRMILRRFEALPADTATVIVVRHAKAGSKKRYKGDDAKRPLDSKGRIQADALVAQLRAFGGSSVTSADRKRCVQTVQPFADAEGLEIRTDSRLSEEGFAEDPVGTRTLVRKIAAGGGVPVISSQGGVIPDLLSWWADADGIELPPARNRKASMWVLSLSGGRLCAADHIDSPLPVKRTV
ncbi:NUDIX domain-containing protein [Rhodococcus sp. NPDC058521]|uniref:NUDIX hydrolase n=1 Tax=Rhodococcus sp. NPDC058521 TaxID=3346536 RepID=UPI00365FF871